MGRRRLSLRASLPRRCPFYYGWVIVACAMCASLARQGAAVATLSVFITPMTAEFGWSRAGLSGAVSLGGVLGALIAPILGAAVDRRGARAMLTLSAIVVATTALALSETRSLLWFYVAFSVGRMMFAGPFDIGISSSVANWFVHRRAQAMSYVSVSTGISLALMPVMAQLAIDARGWRSGWLAIAIVVLMVGAIPNALFMFRRPEDVGLQPDGGNPHGDHLSHSGGTVVEVEYSVREALRTPALWLLMAYTALVFPVQAGVSLHQAPHLVQQGISPTVAASIVGTFSLTAAVSGLGFGYLGARRPVRHGLALAAVLIASGAGAMYGVSNAPWGYLCAALFGAGIGGLLTLLPVAFAEYFGRRHFGAIRGVALPVQVVGQAAGPLIAGLLHDATGSYHVALLTFALLSTIAAVVAWTAGPPVRGRACRPDERE